MRIKHNDLTHYFLRDHDQLPEAYLRSCRKFFKELGGKHQASSCDKVVHIRMKKFLVKGNYSIYCKCSSGREATETR